MNVVATLEHRFEQTRDGAVWTQTQYPHAFWAPYLDVFETVRVVARVRAVEKADPGWKRADGARVTFAAVPYYLGPWQYLLRRGQVIRAARAAVSPDDAVILRVPGQIANCIEPLLRRTGHPYAVEVVADPYDVFAPGSVKHLLAPLLRWWSPRQLRRVCHNAFAASYVTRAALQRRYPCPHESVGCSDVEISAASLATAPRPERQEARRIRLITVGTLAQLYKAPHILIDATIICLRQGLDLELVLIGDGKHRPELQAQAARLGAGDRIQFRGQLTAGDAVRAELDRADVFLLPSFQEGLPRALVEAMARALPCIGSTVGGIPELLPADALVPPGDSAALAAKIRAVVTDPLRLSRMSRANLETARQYRVEILREKRVAFYQYVRDQTSAWLVGQKEKSGVSPLSPCTQGERGRG
jgi:glycosyltransferase involved in cell wall biosynthesis